MNISHVKPLYKSAILSIVNLIKCLQSIMTVLVSGMEVKDMLRTDKVMVRFL